MKPGIYVRGSRMAVLVALGTALACSSAAVGGVPSSTPGIAGRITSVTRAGERIGAIRVEEQPLQASGSAKAVATVTQGTVVLRGVNEPRDFNDLGVGQWVRVWFDGPVMESYPVQAKAGTIVIDSLARSR